MTKQYTNVGSSPTPVRDSSLDEIAALILDHFNNRWGQGAPVTKSEAMLLADTIFKSVVHDFT